MLRIDSIMKIKINKRVLLTKEREKEVMILQKIVEMKNQSLKGVHKKYSVYKVGYCEVFECRKMSKKNSLITNWITRRTER